MPLAEDTCSVSSAHTRAFASRTSSASARGLVGSKHAGKMMLTRVFVK